MKKEIVLINSIKDENLDFINLVLVKFLNHDIGARVCTSVKGRFWNKSSQSKIEIKSRYLGPSLTTLSGSLLFVLMLPVLMIQAILYLVCLRFNTNTGSIILLGDNEKIIFSLLARLFGFKVFWFELPGQVKNNNLLIRFLVRFNLIFSQFIVVFNSHGYKLLEKANLKQKLILLHVFVDGESKDESVLQKSSQDGRKFFNLGIVTHLDEQNNIKNILETIKCLIDVIPNIKVTIVGDGVRRQKLIWVSKSLGLEKYVSFVGDQIGKRNWFLSWDYFVVTNVKPQINDFYLTIQSMFYGTPVIVPKNVGFENIVISLSDRLDVFCDMSKFANLAKQVTKIEQQRIARHKLAEVGQEKVRTKYLARQNIDNLIMWISK